MADKRKFVVDTPTSKSKHADFEGAFRLLHEHIKTRLKMKNLVTDQVTLFRIITPSGDVLDYLTAKAMARELGCLPDDEPQESALNQDPGLQEAAPS